MTAQFLSLNAIKHELTIPGHTRETRVCMGFKKQNNGELPGRIPCSAQSCFQNSIPTVQEKEENKDLSLLSARHFSKEDLDMYSQYAQNMHPLRWFLVNALKKTYFDFHIVQFAEL